MKKKRLLDSFAVLAYLKKEKGYKKVKDLLHSDGSELMINDVNLGEVFYILAKERGIQQAEYFIKVIFPSLPLRNVSNTLSDVIDAAKIKGKYSISYADCFAVATAIRERAVIVTGDPEFRKVKGKVEIEWII